MESLELRLAKEFKGRRVFLTGHTGFKGAWMTCLLQHLGAIVKGFSLEPEEVSLYRQLKGDELCESVFGDIRNMNFLKPEIETFSPDYIFHFAAQPLVIDSYGDPKYTFDVNIGGTVNVIESFRSLSNSCTLLAITTDKVYKNKESITPYKEIDELGGYDPYSASKAAMEIVLQSYANSFGFSEGNKKMVIARAGNVIGGGDWSENRIVPDIARSLLNDETLILRNPQSIRPWQHVLDALVGYLMAVAIPNPESFIYNFGPDTNEKINVEELTKIAMTITNRGNYSVEKEANILKETGTLLLDSSLAKKTLGWQPAWNGHQAISQAMDWYLKYEQGEVPLKICQLNIELYFEAVKHNYV